MTTKQAAQERKDRALAELHDLIKPGDAVYAIERKIAPNGGASVIDFYAVQNNTLHWISGYMAIVTGYKFDEKQRGLRVRGGNTNRAADAASYLSLKMFDNATALSVIRL